MTLGQRIQQLRKDKGLSQEALGDALGVSRQAISKWESDTTIPEIDNLIAMSRLLGTPVGVLLGVEEDDPTSSAAGELTDRELEAVDAIVARYLEKARQQKPKRKIWPIAVGAVVVLFLVFWAKGQLDGLSDRMSSLQNNVNNISNNVSFEINSMADQIQNILEQQASLLDSYTQQVTAVDIPAGTLFLDVTATPKAYTEGMELIFTAKPAGEDPITVQATPVAGNAFQVKNWQLPLNNKIQLSVSFGTSGNWQTQALETLDGYSSNTQLEVYVSATGSCGIASTVEGEDAWFTDWAIDGSIRPESRSADLGGVVPESAELQIRKNGTIVDRIPLELLDDADYAVPFHVDEYMTLTPATIGDTLEYGVFLVDNFGRESFHSYDCASLEADENGNLKPVYISLIDQKGMIQRIVKD